MHVPLTPDNLNLQGKSIKFEWVIGSSSCLEMGTHNQNLGNKSVCISGLLQRVKPEKCFASLANHNRSEESKTKQKAKQQIEGPVQKTTMVDYCST